jgi:formate--tetrahydrofolate ligase
VVAVNRFTTDTSGEIAAIEAYCGKLGVPVALCTHWAEGGRGAEDLARKVVEASARRTEPFTLLYPDDMPLLEKIETVARRIYRAARVETTRAVKAQLRVWEEAGFGHLPVCMAKTQYSFSTDPALLGAPEGHVVRLREVRLAAGAGFIAAICGDIMTMPGLPRHPAAEHMFLNASGQIEGLS